MEWKLLKRTRIYIPFIAVIVVPAHAGLVVNGGFEPDFTGWTHDASGFDLVVCNAGLQHSGNCAARLGPLSPGFLQQTLTTTPGQLYTLDFWLADENIPGSGTWNFHVF